MIDYLQGSIVKLKLNIWNALENKRELTQWWQISSKTLMLLEWDNVTLLINLYIQLPSYQNILIYLDMFPKNDFLPILMKCMAGL